MATCTGLMDCALIFYTPTVVSPVMSLLAESRVPMAIEPIGYIPQSITRYSIETEMFVHSTDCQFKPPVKHRARDAATGGLWEQAQADNGI